MFDIDLHKVPHAIFALVILFVFSTIIGPFWHLFQFHSEIFKSNDTLKLLLFSTAIGCPLLLLNTIFLFINAPTTNLDDPEMHFYVVLMVCCIINVAILYAPLLVTYFIYVTPFFATMISTLVEALFLSFTIIGIVGRNKRKQVSKPS